MKLLKGFKTAAVLLLALGVATGCATKPAEEPVGQVDAAAEQARAAVLDARAAFSTVDPAAANYATISQMIADAEAAMMAGDTGRAIQLANEAKALSVAAVAEAARVASQAADSYTVQRGDSLWTISAKDSIYGNPYQWPLIYKANRSQIKDADLIYPGQQFTIERGASQADVDAAVQHARTRGAWSLGRAEDSDLRYLSR